MKTFVMDASVGIKTIVDEQQSDLATELLECLVKNPPTRCFVPDLFYAECGNILRKYTKRLGLPIDQAKEGLMLLDALDLAVIPIKELASSALEIALSHEISVYDACYIALAEQQNIPLVTADLRLANCMAGTAYQVLTLDSSLF